MPTIDELQFVMSRKSDKALNDMLGNRTQWSDEAIEVATRELEKRKNAPRKPTTTEVTYVHSKPLLDQLHGWMLVCGVMATIAGGVLIYLSKDAKLKLETWPSTTGIIDNNGYKITRKKSKSVYYLFTYKYTIGSHDYEKKESVFKYEPQSEEIQVYYNPYDNSESYHRLHLRENADLDVPGYWFLTGLILVGYVGYKVFTNSGSSLSTTHRVSSAP